MPRSRLPPALLVLCFALALSYVHGQETFIGALSTLQHDVSGDVYAIDSRTLRVDNLNYDGLGPAGVFWVDVVERATPDGRIVPFNDSCEASPKLPPYSGDSVVLELPPDLNLSDVRYFSMWCRAVDAEFGGVSIDPSVVSRVPQLETATCQGGDAAEMSGVFPVRDGWNCEPLNDFYQMRWRLGEDTVDIELVVRLNDGQYAGFGPSGSDNATVMEGSDVAIAHRTENGSFSIVDFHITTKSQCSNGIGVCPDVDLATNAGVDSITNVGGNSAEGVTQFTYTRPLVATDTVDRDIVIEGESFLSWAVGPIADGLPNFHQGSMNFPQPGPDGVKVMIEWGRSPNDACPVFVPSEDGDDDDDSDTGDTSNLPGFVRPTISDVTEITARIGPSGDVRGVAAITGSGNSWGIAWYLSPTGGNDSDILIPAVAVERGKTYTFTVYGGRPDLTAEVHPLYITNSSEGGYDTRTPQERKIERVYAGIEITDEDAEGVYNYTATAAGALCKLTTDVIDTENFTWPQYSDSLNTSCVQNDTITEAGATLTWTVPEDAEDIVYYQCVTHRFLGFKLVVFDEGQVDDGVLAEENGGSPLPSPVPTASQSPANTTCRVTFLGESQEFAACELESFAPLQIYFSIVNGEIDTLFRAPRQNNMDYLAFGWGYNQMVVGDGSNVMVALLGDNGENHTIENYLLRAREAAGVMPAPSNVSDAQVDVTDSFIAGRFKRGLNATGLPSINLGDTRFIWSYGPAGDTRPSLMKHERQEIGNLDVISGRATTLGFANNTRLLLRLHAAFMSVAWVVIVPYAIVAMRFLKKYNPTTFQFHRALNSLAVIFTIVGFFLAVFRSNLGRDPHRFIGYIVFGLALIQGIIGYARPRKETGARLPWYVSHAVVGAVAVILGIVNVFLGITLPFFESLVVWYVLAGVSVGGAVSIFALLSFMPNKFPTRETYITGDKETRNGPTSI